MSNNGLVGPFFFENEEGKTQTVNTKIFIEKLKIFKQTLIKRRFALIDQ